jgi:histidinol-phosphate aminotransferase
MTCDLFSLATPGIARIHPYQPGKPVEELERELGITGIIKLASNENALGPGPRVLEALTALPDLCRYPDGNGFSLKQALSRIHRVNPEQITLGNGSNDILDLVARAFVTDRDQVIFSRHAFAIYKLVTMSLGAEGIETPARDYGHDLSAMLDAVSNKTRLVYIANPNNPTGTWLKATELKQFMDELPGNIMVLMDQAYYEYAVGPGYVNCIEWLDEYPNLVVARTFSKAYGLAGLRVGFGVSHPQAADLMNRVRQPFNVNSVALMAAEIAAGEQQHIAHSVAFNNAGMAQLALGFGNMGISFIPTRANFICFDLGRPAAAIYERLLRVGVIVRPIASYGLPNHLRVTVGHDEENARFLDALKLVLA